MGGTYKINLIVFTLFFFVSIVTTIFSFSEGLENFDLNTMNALFNENDQFPDLNDLGEPITHIQTVKLRMDGSMLFSLGLGQNQKLWPKAEH